MLFSNTVRLTSSFLQVICTSTILNSDIASGRFVQNTSWLQKLAISVSDAKDRIIVLSNGEWIGDINFTNQP